MKCKECGQEIPEFPKRIKVGNYEYDTEDTQKGTTFKNIKILKGAELWTYIDCVKLHNNEKLRRKLNLGNCWFFIKQPFDFNRKKNFVARLDANSDGASMDCDRVPAYSDDRLGVRFKWKVGK